MKFDDIEENFELTDNLTEPEPAFTDINESAQAEPAANSQARKEAKPEKPKNNKKAIAICAAVAAVVIAGALIIAGCTLGWFGGDGSIGDLTVSNGELEVENLSLDGVAKDYILATGIEVNGVDIGGKTILQAQKLLISAENDVTQKLDFTVKVKDKTFEITEKDFEYKYNTESILATAAKYTKELGDKAYAESNPTVKMQLTAELNKDSLKDCVEKTAKKINVDAKDAEITKFNPWSDNKFEYSEEKTGFAVDESDLTAQLKKLIDSNAKKGVIEPKTKITEPKTTVEFLKANIIGLSSFSTYSTNTWNGQNNQKLALERSNGVIIKPGEIYSFLSYAGNTDSEAEGYLSAVIIQNGQYVQGIGGGACQAASTVYKAAVAANLGIIEREGHRWASAYTAAGFDATISDGWIDLRLQNNTEYPVFFETKMENSRLTCNIYGYQDPSFDEIATYSYNYACSVGVDYWTKSYRIYLKDGVEVGREFLGRTNYSLSGGHYVVPADSGTITARPGGQDTYCYVTPDPLDNGLYSHGGNPNPPESDEPEDTTEPTKPTDPPVVTPPSSEEPKPPVSEESKPPVSEPVPDPDPEPSDENVTDPPEANAEA